MARLTAQQQNAVLRRMAHLRNNEGMSNEDARAQAVREIEEGREFGFRGEGAQAQQEEAQRSQPAFQRIGGREFSRFAPPQLVEAFEFLVAQQNNIQRSLQRYQGFANNPHIDERGRQNYRNRASRYEAAIAEDRRKAIQSLRSYAAQNQGDPEALDVLKYFPPAARTEARAFHPTDEGFSNKDEQKVSVNLPGADRGRGDGVGEPPAVGDKGQVTEAPKQDDRQERLARGLAVIDQAVQNGTLSAERASIFKQTLRSVVAKGGSLDAGRILSELQNIEKTSINPEFAQLSREMRMDFQNQQAELDESRRIELEQERLQEGESIRQAQENRAVRGMTFSGEAVQQLGKESAFARPGTEEAEASAIPVQEDFTGTFFEGIIPQQSRLIRTSSQARHAANLRRLQRAAENELGSEGAREAGFSPVVGDVTGRLVRNRNITRGNVLSNLVNQEIKNVQGQQEVDFNFPTQQVTT